MIENIGRKTALLGCMLMLAGSSWAATHEIQLLINPVRFEPNDLTIQVGDTIRWVNNSSFHSVGADDGSFSRPPGSAPWTFEKTFTEPAEEILYFCSVHSSPGRDINLFMNGRLVVEPAGASFQINQGISASWFNPATSGQGFLIDVEPLNQFMFVAWFTFEPGAAGKLGAAENRWLVASGNYVGNRAELPVFVVSGGVFDDPTPVTSTQDGTLVVSFSDCQTGLVEYDLPSQGLQGQITISRAVPGTEALCQTLAMPAE